ncbi:hypothetical protein A3F34_02015 [Candidatus Roizmanbacteria bacterium RIFCSPHIGHO2_12_FULL_44_10]|uniref:Nucleotidyl transferase AbiEii toxin, Type IV TA system n=2 Tax=Patescibacteria group TaxID=1783273 RepID=A0A1F7I6C5_9BACT|nr:MAG: hypothetical protein A3F34_02015 [Candidatus Roizmanbacteria bacterium RIFCSPHIGHO2_12_FULL_44_10]OGN34367.1 MAG: hypothetical protein A3I39_02070 [Candidatus Yanofskybacteria bacterium RIFCSPLOWO2_02_FULL_47_9b]
MFIATLPKATASLIEKIKLLPELKTFYLTGGTALSLQLGHRESEDLDFFSQADFRPDTAQQALMKIGALENTQSEPGALNTFLDGVKLQFLHYPYSLLEKPLEWNGLSLSSVIDIACTKFITISARGSKKDFIDLYKILENDTIANLFNKLDEKYKGVNYNHAHILKSLIYFADADDQPMPRMHMNVDWDEVKQSITENVKKFSF